MSRLEDSVDPDRNTSSLGLLWNTEEDTFRIKSKWLEQPYTKRGLLALLISPFDPPGFISPLLLNKLLQRSIIPRKTEETAVMLKLDCDDPLSECIPEDESLHPDGWQSGRIRWKSLLELREFRLYGFADASEVAVCYAIYLRIVDQQGNVKVSLILGATKVSLLGPLERLNFFTKSRTIRWLPTSKYVPPGREDLLRNLTLLPTYYFTDSKDVLDWIYHKTETFPK